VLIESGALPDDPQTIGKTRDTRSGEGREFSQGKAGCRLELEVRQAFFQQLEGHPTYQVNAGLRVFCLRQFRLRTPKADRRKVIAQGRPGLIKPGSRARAGLGEVLAHPHHLGALPGKQYCGFAHEAVH
jgi:hypothetical protein